MEDGTDFYGHEPSLSRRRAFDLCMAVAMALVAVACVAVARMAANGDGLAWDVVAVLAIVIGVPFSLVRVYVRARNAIRPGEVDD